MRVEELMTREVKTCRAHESLNEAARIMWDEDCGCVPVVDERGAVIGLVTDRDACMAAYTRGARLGEIAIGDVMARQVIACGPHDTVDAAEQLMRKHRIRRLPVVGFERQLLGIVALGDVARVARRGGDGRDRGLWPAAVEETLAAVSEPRAPHVASA